MSYADIINIACEYCSKVIELNLELIPKVTENVLRKKQDLFTSTKKKLELHNDKLKIEINNDEQLKKYLFDIYKDKLDNDKYGINKRS